MKYGVPLFAAVLLAFGTPAEACSLPSYAITTRTQEAYGDWQLYRIRTVNVLVGRRTENEDYAGPLDLLALEAVVIDAPQSDRELTLIRIIVPDRWQGCGQLFDPGAINQAGQIEGYVLLRTELLTGYYETRFGSGRNRNHLLRHGASLEWRAVTFR